MGFGTLRPALGREVIWAGADRYSDTEGACETNGEKTEWTCAARPCHSASRPKCPIRIMPCAKI